MLKIRHIAKPRTVGGKHKRQPKTTDRMKKYFWTLLFLTTIVQSVYPCSSFVLKNGKTILMGKNFDWTFDQGYIIKNLRNISKIAYCTHNGTPASWTSKYGSVTFNQNGKEMPYGGMNEKGR